MSKLSQLKQKAYQAGKNRNWDVAIHCYEQILELEKNNPTVVNELGDLCLKSGETSRAVKHFLSAASRYRKTGLLNNSVAIYKKILRHDDSNISAHWYLADTRAGQGLIVEGEQHATRFLDGSGMLAGDLEEIFLKRCVKLFDLYPSSPVILERLTGIFRTHKRPMETARVECLSACHMFENNDQATARTKMDVALTATPELRNYPEYGRWSQLLDPNTAQASQDADYNTVTLGGDAASPAADEAAVESSDDGALTVEPFTTDSAPVVEIEVPDAPDVAITVDINPPAEDDDCISIDVDGDTDFTELIAAATDGLTSDEPTAETVEQVPEVSVDPEPEPEPNEPAESVDLLAQILSEETESLETDSDQLATITAEIGSVVGGDEGDDDAGRLYEMGMVYLEMGLFDQACESFSVAACEEEFAMRAHEMWGITLQRAQNPDESVKVLTDGLGHAVDGSREALSLRYHIARAHEMAGREDAAVDIYQDIHDLDARFLDVKKRLTELNPVS